MRSKKKTSSRAMMYTTMESPVGRLLLAGDERALRQVSFADGPRSAGVQVGWLENAAAFAEVIRQLKAYFRGELRKFDLPLGLQGTEFQLRVWSALREIPYGETISYRELAERISESRPETKIIYMSGYAEYGAEGKTGVEEGGILLTKPFTRMGIVRMVNDILRANVSK